MRSELDILRPNIIVCGGGSGTVLRIVTEHVYPSEFREVNNRVHYSKSRNLVLIDSWHPSARTIDRKRMYDEIMRPYSKFLRGSI